MKNSDLTQRQIEILKAIISEYVESGKPVGSEILERKYKLGFSPATIRNEMVELARKGFILKNYFSSGRIPSAKAIRFYINSLMEEKKLSTREEIEFKNSIWDEKKEIHKLLLTAARVLAAHTNQLSLIVTDEGCLYYSGVANLLEEGGVKEIKKAKELLVLVEEIEFWRKIVNRLFEEGKEFTVLLGEEDFCDTEFDPFASLVASFGGRKIRGLVSIMGSKRMYYNFLVPQLKFFSHLLGDIVREQGW